MEIIKNTEKVKDSSKRRKNVPLKKKPQQSKICLQLPMIQSSRLESHIICFAIMYFPREHTAVFSFPIRIV